METSFVYNPQRDAWKTIRRFVYQVELSVIRWLTLAKDTVLYCECGEDIDHVRQLLEAETTAQERLLEQVKVRARVTLNSEEVLTSLVRFCESAHENPNIQIHFRFATTATPGRDPAYASTAAPDDAASCASAQRRGSGWNCPLSADPDCCPI